MSAMSPEQAAQAAYQAGFRGTGLQDIVAIMGRESGYNPSAYNPNAATGDNSIGLTQINTIGSLLGDRVSRLEALGYNTAGGDPSTVQALLMDPAVNLAMAYQMSSQGTNFFPWGGYKGMSNTYGTNMDAAATAIQNAQAAGMFDPNNPFASAGILPGDPGGPYQGGGLPPGDPSLLYPDLTPPVDTSPAGTRQYDPTLNRYYTVDAFGTKHWDPTPYTPPVGAQGPQHWSPAGVDSSGRPMQRNDVTGQISYGPSPTTSASPTDPNLQPWNIPGTVGGYGTFDPGATDPNSAFTVVQPGMPSGSGSNVQTIGDAAHGFFQRNPSTGAWDPIPGMGPSAGGGGSVQVISGPNGEMQRDPRTGAWSIIPGTEKGSALNGLGGQGMISPNDAVASSIQSAIQRAMASAASHAPGSVPGTGYGGSTSGFPYQAGNTAGPTQAAAVNQQVVGDSAHGYMTFNQRTQSWVPIPGTGGAGTPTPMDPGLLKLEYAKLAAQNTAANGTAALERQKLAATDAIARRSEGLTALSQLQSSIGSYDPAAYASFYAGGGGNLLNAEAGGGNALSPRLLDVSAQQLGTAQQDLGGAGQSGGGNPFAGGGVNVPGSGQFTFPSAPPPGVPPPTAPPVVSPPSATGGHGGGPNVVDDARQYAHPYQDDQRAVFHGPTENSYVPSTSIGQHIYDSRYPINYQAGSRIDANNMVGAAFGPGGQPTYMSNAGQTSNNPFAAPTVSANPPGAVSVDPTSPAIAAADALPPTKPGAAPVDARAVWVTNKDGTHSLGTGTPGAKGINFGVAANDAAKAKTATAVQFATPPPVPYQAATGMGTLPAAPPGQTQGGPVVSTQSLPGVVPPAPTEWHAGSTVTPTPMGTPSPLAGAIPIPNGPAGQVPPLADATPIPNAPPGDTAPLAGAVPLRYAMGTGMVNSGQLEVGDSTAPNPFAGGAKPEMILNPTHAPLGVINSRTVANMTQNGHMSPTPMQNPFATSMPRFARGTGWSGPDVPGWAGRQQMGQQGGEGQQEGRWQGPNVPGWTGRPQMGQEGPGERGERWQGPNVPGWMGHPASLSQGAFPPQHLIPPGSPPSPAPMPVRPPAFLGPPVAAPPPQQQGQWGQMDQQGQQDQDVQRFARGTRMHMPMGMPPQGGGQFPPVSIFPQGGPLPQSVQGNPFAQPAMPQRFAFGTFANPGAAYQDPVSRGVILPPSNPVTAAGTSFAFHPGNQTAYSSPSGTLNQQVLNLRQGQQYPHLNINDPNYFNLDPSYRQSFETGQQTALGVPVQSTQWAAQQNRLQGFQQGQDMWGY